ncbi:DUF551 domain-containing protein [Escherichia coli]|uniref:DUF551 domain-containing protein n=1 Tax=Escherichia coli TaxID=562 RepID=UPI003D6CB727
MTTFTDKELIKEIKERISSLDVRDNIERRAYEIALASLEADPVAYIFKHPAGKLFWALTDESNKEQADVIPVYAAPPVPVVPEEKPMPNPIKMYAVDAVAAIAEVRGWNACRAAMLQSQGNCIKDGWISCSERMPEMGERQCYVLAADFKNNYPPNIPNTQVGVYGDWFNDGNPTWDDGDGEDLYLKEVTHWMPLPEPPQEVNRG